MIKDICYVYCAPFVIKGIGKKVLKVGFTSRQVTKRMEEHTNDYKCNMKSVFEYQVANQAVENRIHFILKKMGLHCKYSNRKELYIDTPANRKRIFGIIENNEFTPAIKTIQDLKSILDHCKVEYETNKKELMVNKLVCIRVNSEFEMFMEHINVYHHTFTVMNGNATWVLYRISDDVVNWLNTPFEISNVCVLDKHSVITHAVEPIMLPKYICGDIEHQNNRLAMYFQYLPEFYFTDKIQLKQLGDLIHKCGGSLEFFRKIGGEYIDCDSVWESYGKQEDRWHNIGFFRVQLLAVTKIDNVRKKCYRDLVRMLYENNDVFDDIICDILFFEYGIVVAYDANNTYFVRNGRCVVDDGEIVRQFVRKELVDVIEKASVDYDGDIGADRVGSRKRELIEYVKSPITQERIRNILRDDVIFR